MNNNNSSFKIPTKGIFFMSLGGIGEIGANCYLYCCDGKWLMIDLGLTFADEKFPGIDLLVPKIDFIDSIADKLEAIIISHGHEDHAGALAFLANKFQINLESKLYIFFQDFFLQRPQCSFHLQQKSSTLTEN